MINIYRLRGVEKQLKRLGDLMELYLEAAHGIRRGTPKIGATEEPDVAYVNEELDWMREQAAKMGLRLPKDLQEED